MLRKHLTDDHASPTHIEERVIVADVRRHPTTIDNASKDYAKAISSTIKFLVEENDQMEKELHEAS